jgi:hypothetical protein
LFKQGRLREIPNVTPEKADIIETNRFEQEALDDQGLLKYVNGYNVLARQYNKDIGNASNLEDKMAIYQQMLTNRENLTKDLDELQPSSSKKVSDFAKSLPDTGGYLGHKVSDFSDQDKEILKSQGKLQDVYEYDQMVLNYYNLLQKNPSVSEVKDASAKLTRERQKLIGDYQTYDPYITTTPSEEDIKTRKRERETITSSKFKLDGALKEYEKIKEQFMSAGSLMDPSQRNRLYERLLEYQSEVNKQNKIYQEEVYKYRNTLNQTTNLQDTSLEVHPLSQDTSLDERNKYWELQQMENALEENQTAVDQYNHQVRELTLKYDPKENPDQFYEDRMRLVRALYKSYNIQAPEVKKDSVEQVIDDQFSQTDLVPVDDKRPDNTTLDRPDFIDPAEAKLFGVLDKNPREDYERFVEYSKVNPNNGLGSYEYNPLVRKNARYYNLRFKNNFKTADKPGFVPTNRGLDKLYAGRDDFQMSIPTRYSAYGMAQFTDETPDSNYILDDHLQPQNMSSWHEKEFVQNRRWNPFHPINKNYNPNKVINKNILEQRGFGAGYALPKYRPSMGENIQKYDYQTGYDFHGATMRDDEAFCPGATGKNLQTPYYSERTKKQRDKIFKFERM